MTLAILGASGHIGKNLVERFSNLVDCKLHLFLRDSAKAQSFCASVSPKAEVTFASYSDFGRVSYDAVINCIGIADPRRLANAGHEIFRVTEEFDNLVLGYLDRHDACRYVSISSGAAYGSDFSEPASDERNASYQVNPVRPEEFYGLAKLHAEAKHRARAERHIVDLRLFGFFSKHIDIESKYLLSDAARCLLRNQRMETGDTDIMRDYVHPDDLFRLVELSLEGARSNQVLDVYSAAPAGKFEILKMLNREFGLEYEVVGSAGVESATGAKSNYYSLSRRARATGYEPRYSSIDAVRIEMRALLGEN